MIQAPFEAKFTLGLQYCTYVEQGKGKVKNPKNNKWHNPFQVELNNPKSKLNGRPMRCE